MEYEPLRSPHRQGGDVSLFEKASIKWKKASSLPQLSPAALGSFHLISV